MPLYRITTKKQFINGNLLIEKGMSIQVSSFANNPLYYNQGQDINDAFMRIYGFDLRPFGLLNVSFLEVEKV